MSDHKNGACSHCSASKKECKTEGRKRGGACCNECFRTNGRG